MKPKQRPLPGMPTPVQMSDQTRAAIIEEERLINKAIATCEANIDFIALHKNQYAKAALKDMRAIRTTLERAAAKAETRTEKYLPF